MAPPQPQQVAAAAVTALVVSMLLHRRRRKTTPSSTPPQHIRPLPDFSTLPRVGWRWERWKTADENWLDLAYLVARASEAKDGHMGCCIVRDPHGREPSLISTTINCGIYGRYRSDLHAEAAAVSDCARRGEKLEGLDTDGWVPFLSMEQAMIGAVITGYSDETWHVRKQLDLVKPEREWSCSFRQQSLFADSCCKMLIKRKSNL